MWKNLTEAERLTRIGQVLTKFNREELKNPVTRKSFEKTLENLYGLQAQVIIQKLEKNNIIPKVEGSQ